MNNNFNIAEVYNSATFFGLVAAIVIGIMLLLVKQDINSRDSKKKK